MHSGIPICILGALSFGLLACVANMAERRKCDTSVVALWLFAWSVLAMLARSVTLFGQVHLSARVVLLAAALGACAAIAFLAFQKSMAWGQVIVAWLMMNLSTGIPVLVSIWLYKEPVSAIKIVAFALALIALLCLFQAGRLESGVNVSEVKENEKSRTVWVLLMVIILLTNGISAFGLKVLPAWGLSSSITYPYLTIWYAAALVCAAIPMLLRKVRGGRKEIFWGALMAAFSMGGQLAMAAALNRGLPGNIVFSVTIGGSILVVAIAGRLFFGEKMHPLSWTGVTIGGLAVVLLSIS